MEYADFSKGHKMVRGLEMCRNCETRNKLSHGRAIVEQFFGPKEEIVRARQRCGFKVLTLP